MDINILLIMLVISVLAFALYLIKGDNDSLLQYYKNRRCTGTDWKNEFPDASSQNVREFLEFFTYSFAISEVHNFKFKPTDKLLKIYTDLNLSKWGGDVLEFEILAQELKK